MFIFFSKRINFGVKYVGGGVFGVSSDCLNVSPDRLKALCLVFSSFFVSFVTEFDESSDL